jgi:hypothetical protein
MDQNRAGGSAGSAGVGQAPGGGAAAAAAAGTAAGRAPGQQLRPSGWRQQQLLQDANLGEQCSVLASKCAGTGESAGQAAGAVWVQQESARLDPWSLAG